MERRAEAISDTLCVNRLAKNHVKKEGLKPLNSKRLHGKQQQQTNENNKTNKQTKINKRKQREATSHNPTPPTPFVLQGGQKISASKTNKRSSEIQGTALGKCLRAWTCTHRSMPAGLVQSRHAFVGGYSKHLGKMTDTRKQKAEMASEMPIKHSLFVGTCRSDSSFPQLVV